MGCQRPEPTAEDRMGGQARSGPPIDPLLTLCAGAPRPPARPRPRPTSASRSSSAAAAAAVALGEPPRPAPRARPRRFSPRCAPRYPQHYALVVLLAYTGLRFCHASVHWSDGDEAGGVLRVPRKQVRGKVGPITRKKRAPTEYPVEPEVAAILKDHRKRLLKDQAPGLANGLMFPSMVAPTARRTAWMPRGRSASRRRRSTSASPYRPISVIAKDLSRCSPSSEFRSASVAI